jgi:uncharacterized protein YjbI with pentapeptide repeats/type II secretory pathway component PulM
MRAQFPPKAHAGRTRSPTVMHVLKRWAAWPQRIRWLTGIAAVVLTLVFLWALFVPLADWLAHHDVGPATGPLHETAVDNVRGRLLTLGAGLLAAGALVFTALNFSLLRRNSEQADQWQRRTHELTEQGQVTDRYTKAIEQLGSSTVDVTIGGIYALERIARDSLKDHPTVMEVLAACIREHSSQPMHEPAEGPGKPEPVTRPDIQAAVTVIGRRDTTHDDGRRINLRNVHLPGADLPKANLADADLTSADPTSANLTGAKLHKANLTGASLRAVLTGTDLTEANLTEAKLRGALLVEANLTGTDLTYADLRDAQVADANLSGANLSGAILTGANLTSANLSGARLAGANLSGAKLIGAKLTDADLTATAISMSDPFSEEVEEVRYVGVNLLDADLTDADLTGADLTGAVLTGAVLTGAKWPENAPVPEGWKRDADSGRLRRAGTGAETAEAT